MLHRLKAERVVILSSSAANEHSPADVCLSEHRPVDLFPVPSPSHRALRGAGRQAKARIPGSARYEHDKKRESEGGNPPSGHEKPELPCLVLFTPGNNRNKKDPSGNDTIVGLRIR
jgi:hypothetical protein